MTAASAAGAVHRGRPALVTGGAGFIGSHLVDALLARGVSVRVLDDLSSGRAEHLDAARAAAGERAARGCELLVADLRDAAACRAACRGVGIVFHQAARVSVPLSMARPEETLEVNVGGTATLLDAARDAGVERVVYASSASVYGDAGRLPSREGEEGLPQSPYALSKRRVEELASDFQARFGLPTVGLRYFNVYGPRQDPEGPYAAVVPRFAAALLGGGAPEVHGDGGQSRDFVFVGDVVAANLRAATAASPATGRAYNVASGRSTTLLELLAALQRLFGTAREPAFAAAREGDPRRSLGDPSLAARALGFTCTVDLEEGLARSLDWYRQVARAATAPGHPSPAIARTSSG